MGDSHLLSIAILLFAHPHGNIAISRPGFSSQQLVFFVIVGFLEVFLSAEDSISSSLDRISPLCFRALWQLHSNELKVPFAMTFLL
ncbi:unnamed protein product [Sphenostylis stenocarpa]|uniref:Uncharacterized protein n=1 Tax=Sphenostylis stenocarpa TaxID=92480 RepID=A0AA86SP54_9FABA|nr:unnamed protein product [Sphenostylis stenocarpa]